VANITIQIEGDQAPVVQDLQAAPAGLATEAVAPTTEATRFSTEPWDGSKTRFELPQLRASVPAACRAHGDALAKRASREPSKADYKLPIREPNGSVNVNALNDAASVLGGGRDGVDLPPEVQKAALAEIQALQAAYRQMAGKEALASDPTPSDVRMVLEAAADAEVDLVRYEGNVGSFTAEEVAEGREPTGSRVKVAIIHTGVSKNGNHWRAPVLQEAIPLFEGCKVYYDHRDHTQRSVRDLVGIIKNARMEGDTMVGDLRTTRAAGWFRGAVLDVPEALGMSVYVGTRSKPSTELQGVEDIQKIVYVRSVDVVDNPSAGGGIVTVMEQTAAAALPTEQETADTDAGPSTGTGTGAPDGDARKEARTVNEQEIKAAMEAQKAELERLKAENAKMLAEAEAVKQASELREAELRKLQSAKLVDEVLVAEKARLAAEGFDLKPVVEADVRRALDAALAEGAVTKELAEQVVRLQVERVKAIAQAYAPAAAMGIPPKATTTKTEALGADPRKAAAGYLYRMAGVALPRK
jgi:hypothetical protein